MRVEIIHPDGVHEFESNTPSLERSRKMAIEIAQSQSLRLPWTIRMRERSDIYDYDIHESPSDAHGH